MSKIQKLKSKIEELNTKLSLENDQEKLSVIKKLIELVEKEYAEAIEMTATPRNRMTSAKK